MDLYQVLLFAHIAAAVVVVGSSFIGPLLGAALRRSRTVEAARPVADLHLLIAKATGPAAGVVGLAGATMWVMRWSIGDGWLVVSLTLFLLAGIGANVLLIPHAARVAELAETAPDGPVPTELSDAVHDGKMRRVGHLFLSGDLAILFLMTNKPGWAGSAAVVATAFALGMTVSFATGRRAVPAAAA